MEELFVSYEIALELKNKGFNEPCIFDHDSVSGDVCTFRISTAGGYVNKAKNRIHNAHCTAILYQQAVDWFREKHNILIYINWDLVDGLFEDYYLWYPFIGRIHETRCTKSNKGCKTYSEALYQAIEEALKLIK